MLPVVVAYLYIFYNFTDCCHVMFRFALISMAGVVVASIRITNGNTIIYDDHYTKLHIVASVVVAAMYNSVC